MEKHFYPNYRETSLPHVNIFPRSVRRHDQHIITKGKKQGCIKDL